MEGKEKKRIVSSKICLQVVEKDNSAKVADLGFQKTINRPR